MPYSDDELRKRIEALERDVAALKDMRCPMNPEGHVWATVVYPPEAVGPKCKLCGHSYARN